MNRSDSEDNEFASRPGSKVKNDEKDDCLSKYNGLVNENKHLRYGYAYNLKCWTFLIRCLPSREK